MRSVLVVGLLLAGGCLTGIPAVESPALFSATSSWSFHIEEPGGTRQASIEIGDRTVVVDSGGNPRTAIDIHFAGAAVDREGQALSESTDGTQQVALDRLEFLGARPNGPREYESLGQRTVRAWQFNAPGTLPLMAVVEPILFVPLTVELSNGHITEGGLSIREVPSGWNLKWEDGPAAHLENQGAGFRIKWWWQQVPTQEPDMVAWAEPAGNQREALSPIPPAAMPEVLPAPGPLQTREQSGATVYHSPAPAALPSFDAALGAALEQLLIKTSPLPETLLVHRWQWYRNLTTIIGGPLEDPTNSAEGLWIFQFVAVPPSDERWQIDIVEHRSPAGPWFVDTSPPTMVSGPPYRIDGSLDVSSLTATLTLSQVEERHLTATKVARDQIGWAWAYPGSPYAFAYWIQGSGCFPDNADRPSTVTHTSAIDGHLRYGFFNESYSGVNACGMGVTPPFN